MLVKPALKANAVFIDVLSVIDTEKVKLYPNPSKDQSKPTPIGHDCEFMVCSDERGIVSGQGTADLNFKANPGDFVRFRSVSVYQNSDDAVIIYGIQYNSGDHVFNNFNCNVVTLKGAAAPDPSQSNGLPAVHESENFTSFDAVVKGAGKEFFNVQFALYTLGSDGETQNLYGYYTWDPTITVS